MGTLCLSRFRTSLRGALLLALLAALVPVAAAQSTDSTAAADSLLLELQRAMGAFAEPAPTAAAVPARTRPSTNPDISVIGDVRGSYSSEGPRNVDLGFHEAEFAFKSVVDPFARADFYVSAASEDGEVTMALEEAYLTTLALPAHLQLKVGKFRSAVGKINGLHPHALPFIDTPLVYEKFFGDEGLNDQGASLSWLVPNTRFYQELTLEVTAGPEESPSFARSDRNRLLYTAHLKNFWDLSEDATLELGLTSVYGPNDLGRATRIGGIDVSYKWKPLRFNTYRYLLLQAEVFAGRRELSRGSLASWGMYGLAGYQLTRRVFFTGRFDRAEDPQGSDPTGQAVSTTLGWNLTEFQKLEVGARTWWDNDSDPTLTGLVRLVFVIGTHGAHEY